MTVKLAKFFSNNSTVTSQPLSLPNATVNSAHHYYNYQSHHNQHHHNHHQEQEQQLPIMQPPLAHYNNSHHPTYYDDDDEDNMSMYSTTTSIMTARDHQFNNSQRPLLPARKPAQLLHKKKFNAMDIRREHEPQQIPQQKSYMSPYVQQQKRDSAKGLHGFNDFDILSQQYNKHLQSPHIGYPYGSPPSPTALSSDFVFDAIAKTSTTTATTTMTTTGTAAVAATKLNQHYANINNFSITTPANVCPNNVNDTIDYNSQSTAATATAFANINSTSTPPSKDFMGKSSRFEDDFCSRRNDIFEQAHTRFDAKSTGSDNSASSSSGGGPFIFGMPPENQGDFMQRLPSCKVRELNKSTDTVICPPDRDYDHHNYSPSMMTLSAKSTMQQSSSDTSSSSQDTNSNACDTISGNRKNGIRFHLLRTSSKSKNKKKTKKNKPSEVNNAPQLSNKLQKPTIKCVLVGDGAVGKTNLILSYLENRFNPEHVPTASDIYNADVMVNDSPVHLTLCDTAGQDTLDPLRELCYPDSDVFLLCFSVVKPETFDAIKRKWAPKFAKTKAALILVGTQADLRMNSNVLNKLQTNGEKAISYADAWDLATSIGAKYIETSSATQDKVKEVFDTAIWDGLLPSALPPTPPLWKKLLCLA